MKLIILAAGDGTRCRPLTDTMPKPLLYASQTTLLEQIMSNSHHVVTEYIVVVSAANTQIQNRIGESFQDTPVVYTPQSKDYGTAAAVESALGYIDSREETLVCNGDCYYPKSTFTQLASCSGSTIATTIVEHPGRYGVVVSHSGIVEKILEKPDNPPKNTVNIGAYRLSETASSLLNEVGESKRGERELTDLINLLTTQESVTITEVDGNWVAVDYPWDLLDLLERTTQGITVHDSATVHPGATLRGPCYIGADATVGPNAEIKNSILMDGAAVPHHAYVGDSVIGPNSNLGAGTMIANLRHDENDIRGGRRKCGAFLGEGVKTGVNTSINPGVRIAAGETTKPGAVIYEDRL